jgi:alpha-galactosidase
MEAIRKAAEDRDAPVSRYIPAEKSTGHDHINIVDALVNDKPGEYVVNIPNDGAIEGLPDDVVVEIPAIVSGRGVQGLRIGRLPELITLYLKSAVVGMEFLLSAYLTGSRDVLAASLLNDPCSRASMMRGEPWLVGSLDEAKSRADALIASDEELAARFAKPGTPAQLL